MDGNNGARPRGHLRAQQPFVQVQGVRAHVHEDRPGPPEDERIDGGHEREGRDDHLIAGLNVQQEGGHLQRMGARGGQQDAGGAQDRAQQVVTLLGEGAVAGGMLIANGLFEVLQFRAVQIRHVEGDHHRFHLDLLNRAVTG